MNKNIGLVLSPFLKLKFLRSHLSLFHSLFYQNILPKKKGLFIRDGFKLALDSENLIDARIIYTGSYEPELRAVFKRIINDGGVILDIGANIGYHTLLFSKVCGPNGKVYSFEPVKKTFERLHQNVTINEITNVVALNFALGNSDIDLTIDTKRSGVNPGSISLLNTAEEGEKITCKDANKAIRDLNIKKINFIKIDVEGYEWFVLDSLKHIIKEIRPVIVFEWDMNYQANSNIQAEDFHHYFAELQYDLFLAEDKLNSKIDNLNTIKGANILAVPQ